MRQLLYSGKPGDTPGAPERPIWAGIYSHISQVPGVGDGFNGQRFARQSQSSTRLLLEAARAYKTIPKQTSGQDSILPLLVGLVADRTGKARVLDFGGGTGAAFIHVVSSLSPDAEVTFDIVEMPVACALGEEIFAGDSRIRFHPALPDVRGDFDIVHVASALQYVDDYGGLLRDLCALRAPYFLLANLSAADIPTYATAQRVYGDMVVPYWFLNLDEVVNIFSEQSYRLLWAGSVQRTYDQSNFPPEYRMGQTCNLLFRWGGERA